MPRDSNGNYKLPLADVIGGQPITATWANTTMADIAAAMTDSLSRSGDGGMDDPFTLFDGSSGAPGLSFINDPTMGWYRAASGDLRSVVGGVDQVRFQAGGPEFWDDTESSWVALKAMADDIAALQDEVVPSRIPAGTKMLFGQASAPVGWTGQGVLDDAALRLVAEGTTGGGGSLGRTFSSVFVSGYTTGNGSAHGHGVTVANHTLTAAESGQKAGVSVGALILNNNDDGANIGSLTAGAGIQQNTYTLSGAPASSGHDHDASASLESSHTHDVALDIAYYDIILATKDAY